MEQDIRQATDATVQPVLLDPVAMARWREQMDEDRDVAYAFNTARSHRIQ